MRKQLLAFLILTIIPCLTLAQKKELSQARSILKSKRNVEQAEKLMTGLLKNEANRENKRIYSVWYDAVLMQYQTVNEKLYLKQKQDTAQFFELTHRLFRVAESLDSLDARPDKKGRVNPEFRRDHAELLTKIRPNLYAAITYYIKKNNFKKAFDFSETYMDCAKQPLFNGFVDSTDARMSEAAYWATYIGFRLKDPVLTLRHRHLALRDTGKAEFTLQYMAEARSWLKDDSLYATTLQEGFRRYPGNAYFFPHLMDYYALHEQHEEALNTVNQALEYNDSSELFLYAKSAVLFSMGKYDESIALSNSLIERNDTLALAYYNAGTAYLNKALELHPLREKKALRTIYQHARRYMERYRLLAPDDLRKWGPALYRIYLNLNMGKQFDEIDRLLKK